jgi:hypothetical protein
MLAGKTLQFRIPPFWLAMVAASFLFGAHAQAALADDPARPDLLAEGASDDARYARGWVASMRDNRGLPFVIVDKKDARIYVFDGNARLRGASSVLLGLTPGDQSAQGMAQREVSSLRRDERTTPSGRFVSEPGHNLSGEAIVWFDYSAKLAIHRLRPADPRERRAERLVSAQADDKRVSLGCVIVPVAFYETVIAPVLGSSYSVVYVLPETRPVQQMLGELQLSQR